MTLKARAPIELLCWQVARRIVSRGLSAAWSAWHDFWSARAFAYERLRECGNRLKAPEVAGMFSFWSADVIESRARMELKALKRREDALASGQSALKARTTLIANDDDSDCATDDDRSHGGRTAEEEYP